MIARGTRPRFAKLCVPPVIVYVLPAPVWPYANAVDRKPSNELSMSGTTPAGAANGHPTAPLPLSHMAAGSLPVGTYGSPTPPYVNGVRTATGTVAAGTSALAAGCPVILKAHGSHPGTAELVGQAVSASVLDCALAEGTFSLVYGTGRETGSALVRHPALKAAGFTGSRAGGQALMKLAAERPEPIPFYAEMSRINPVFILPGAMAESPDQLAAGLPGSMTLGVGQFCTNPGLTILDGTADIEPVGAKLGELVVGSPGATMLNSGISDAYDSGADLLRQNSAVDTVALGQTAGGQCQSGAARRGRGGGRSSSGRRSVR